MSTTPLYVTAALAVLWGATRLWASYQAAKRGNARNAVDTEVAAAKQQVEQARTSATPKLEAYRALKAKYDALRDARRDGDK